MRGLISSLKKGETNKYLVEKGVLEKFTVVCWISAFVLNDPIFGHVSILYMKQKSRQLS